MTKSIYVVDDASDYRFLIQQVFRRYLPQYPLVLLPDGQALVDHVTRLPGYPLLSRCRG